MPAETPPPSEPPPVAAPAATAATKPWWRSKTLWFNALCAALGSAEAGLGLLQPLLASVGANAYAALAFVLAVGNAALRVLTHQAVIR